MSYFSHDNTRAEHNALELVDQLKPCTPDFTYTLHRKRRKFTMSMQPAKAYDGKLLMMSGPVRQWPT